jgi:hypothetical protein
LKTLKVYNLISINPNTDQGENMNNDSSSEIKTMAMDVKTELLKLKGTVAYPSTFIASAEATAMGIICAEKVMNQNR